MAIRRYHKVPGIIGWRDGLFYSTGLPGSGIGSGPDGAASMTFFCVIHPLVPFTSAQNHYFNRSDHFSAGWGVYSVVGTLRIFVYNPSLVQVTIFGEYRESSFPSLLICSYQNGTLSVWLNGVLSGSTSSGSGFSPFNGPVCVGTRSTGYAGYTILDPTIVSDCGMLYNYDPTSFVSPIFGSGAEGLNEQWWDDFRQGRYLTWPRTPTPGQDWHWSALDCVRGQTTENFWVDRYSSTSLVLSLPNLLQGASFAPL